MPVAEEWVPRREAEKDFNLERLPQDTDELIRIIKIGGYDACPCIGPHIGTTAEIGRFRITTTSFENGVLRIRYRLSMKT
jgi:Ser-tRNA(Ala) deacylase AlaX